MLSPHLHNSCSENEFEELVEWVKAEAAKREGKSWGFDDWNSFEPELKNKDHKKYSALLDKIHHEINLNDQRENKVITMGKVTSWLSRAAAILKRHKKQEGGKNMKINPRVYGRGTFY